MTVHDLIPSVNVISEEYGVIHNASFSFEKLPAFMKEHALALGLDGSGALAITASEYSENKVVIANDTVTVFYSSEAGARQALGYLAQLVISGYGELPCATFSFINPAFDYRGFMLDPARHFIPADEIIRFLRFNAMHGYNVFHFHISDDQGWRFSVPGYDKLESIASFHMDPEYPEQRLGGFFSDEDLRSIVDAASSLGITVIPEVDMPGHSRALLAAYPEFGCREESLPVAHTYGIFKEVLNPYSEELWIFIEKMICKLAGIFPAPYFHIGGDECPHIEWEENAAIRKRMAEDGFKNTDELQNHFASRMASIAAKYGKRTIGWDEILATDNMPSDVIVMSWRGMEGAVEAARRGHDAIITSAYDGCYFDYSQSAADYEAGNLGSAYIKSVFNLPIRKEQHILGGQWNLWTEKITSGRMAEYMAYPRSFALAEVLWLGDGRDWESFKLKKRALEALCAASDMVCSPGRWE